MHLPSLNPDETETEKLALPSLTCSRTLEVMNALRDWRIWEPVPALLISQRAMMADMSRAATEALKPCSVKERVQPLRKMLARRPSHLWPEGMQSEELRREWLQSWADD